MTKFPLQDEFSGEMRIFIAIINEARKNKDIEFLTGEKIVKVGENLGINSGVCYEIKKRFCKLYSENPSL